MNDLVHLLLSVLAVGGAVYPSTAKVQLAAKVLKEV
jgi:hypothetical protein